MVRRILALVIPLAMLAAVAAVALQWWYSKPPPRTAVARLGSISFTVSANGRVAAERQVEVGPKVGGRVADLLAKEGDLVRAGQVLARLEDREARARLRQAESAVAVAQARWDEVKSGPRPQEVAEARALVDAARAHLEQAEDHLARAQRLFDAGVGPRAELDDARRAVALRAAQLRATQQRLSLLEAGPRKETVEAAEAAHREAVAALEAVRTELDNLVVGAPMDGRVITKHLEPGSVVRPGEPLYTLADSARLLVRAEVDESDAGKVKLGLPAVVTSDAFPGRKIEGVVKKIAWRVGRKRVRTDNPAEMTDVKVLEVEVPIEPLPEYRIGMAMDVKVLTDKKDRALLIPRAAVQRRGPDLLVSVVKADKTVEERRVVLGAFEAQNVEVLEGLKPGDAVVVGRE